MKYLKIIKKYQYDVVQRHLSVNVTVYEYESTKRSARFSSIARRDNFLLFALATKPRDPPVSLHAVF